MYDYILSQSLQKLQPQKKAFEGFLIWWANFHPLHEKGSIPHELLYIMSGEDLIVVRNMIKKGMWKIHKVPP